LLFEPVLVAFLLCFGARAAAGQITPRDTAALAGAVAERMQTQFGSGIAREPFVVTPRNPLASPEVDFAKRVSNAIRARDSLLIVLKPTRSTRRIQIGALGLAGDTAIVPLWVAWCKGTPDIYGWHDASLAFRRVRDDWTFVERNVGGSGGANNGCPW
jgi:hypothetical protein